MIPVVLIPLLIATVSPQQYSSQWAVHIEGGQQAADEIAEKHGFQNLGEVRAYITKLVLGTCCQSVSPWTPLQVTI